MTRAEFLDQLEGLYTFPIEQQEALFEQMDHLWKAEVCINELERRSEDKLDQKAKQYGIEFDRKWNNLFLKERWLNLKIEELPVQARVPIGFNWVIKKLFN